MSLIVTQWHPGLLEETIEVENRLWMPGYAARVETFLGRYMAFPQGQLAVLVDGRLGGWVSIQRAHWDGSSHMLQTWDRYAGVKADFTDSVVPDGNTLVMMSMCSVTKGAVSALIAAADALAHQLGIEHLIVMARPDGFGEYFFQQFHTLGYREYCTAFEQYITSGTDHWLSILMAKGFSQLKQISWYSVEIPYPEEELEQLQVVWYPQLWWKFGSAIYCRHELGFFKGGKYTEPNLALEKPLNL